MNFFGNYPWESHDDDTKLAIGGALLFIGNARVVVNLICSGMFDRYPALKMVSVESGMGWVPFILEALDYEMDENAPAAKARMKLIPSEYFKQNIYATTWFEHRNLAALSTRSARTTSCSDRLPPDCCIRRAEDRRGESAGPQHRYSLRSSANCAALQAHGRPRVEGNASAARRFDRAGLGVRAGGAATSAQRGSSALRPSRGRRWSAGT
jgi:hypothetical protein